MKHCNLVVVCFWATLLASESLSVITTQLPFTEGEVKESKEDLERYQLLLNRIINPDNEDNGGLSEGIPVDVYDAISNEDFAKRAFNSLQSGRGYGKKRAFSSQTARGFGKRASFANLQLARGYGKRSFASQMARGFGKRHFDVSMARGFGKR